MFDVWLSKTFRVKMVVPNLWAACEKVRLYIEIHDLGASEFSGGEIIDRSTNTTVARVSYNGRLWNLKGRELTEHYPREHRKYIKQAYKD